MFSSLQETLIVGTVCQKNAIKLIQQKITEDGVNVEDINSISPSGPNSRTSLTSNDCVLTQRGSRSKDYIMYRFNTVDNVQYCSLDHSLTFDFHSPHIDKTTDNTTSQPIDCHPLWDEMHILFYDIHY